MKRIAFLSMCMVAVVSCSTIGHVGNNKNSSQREFVVKVNNVSDYIQLIGVSDYEDKKELLGLSSKALYEKSLIQTIPVGGSYLYETTAKGVVITYNYRGRNVSYGKRARWRPGDSRQIFIEYEFRNSSEGSLIQISEE